MTYYRRQRFESFKRALFAERLSAPAPDHAVDIAPETDSDRQAPVPPPEEQASNRLH